MGRVLATDVFVDDVRYKAGTSEDDLAEISTEVPVEGKKPLIVSVAARITAEPAWRDDSEPVPDEPVASVIMTEDDEPEPA